MQKKLDHLRMQQLRSPPPLASSSVLDNKGFVDLLGSDFVCPIQVAERFESPERFENPRTWADPFMKSAPRASTPEGEILGRSQSPGLNSVFGTAAAEASDADVASLALNC